MTAPAMSLWPMEIVVHVLGFCDKADLDRFSLTSQFALQAVQSCWVWKKELKDKKIVAIPGQEKQQWISFTRRYTTFFSQCLGITIPPGATNFEAMSLVQRSPLLVHEFIENQFALKVAGFIKEPTPEKDKDLQLLIQAGVIPPEKIRLNFINGQLTILHEGPLAFWLIGHGVSPDTVRLLLQHPIHLTLRDVMKGIQHKYPEDVLLAMVNAAKGDSEDGEAAYILLQHSSSVDFQKAVVSKIKVTGDLLDLAIEKKWKESILTLLLDAFEMGDRTHTRAGTLLQSAIRGVWDQLYSETLAIRLINCFASQKPTVEWLWELIISVRGYTESLVLKVLEIEKRPINVRVLMSALLQKRSETLALRIADEIDSNAVDAYLIKAFLTARYPVAVFKKLLEKGIAADQLRKASGSAMIGFESARFVISCLDLISHVSYSNQILEIIVDKCKEIFENETAIISAIDLKCSDAVLLKLIAKTKQFGEQVYAYAETHKRSAAVLAAIEQKVGRPKTCSVM